MHYTRIYADDNGNSRFEWVLIPLSAHETAGLLSSPYESGSLIFQENDANYNWELHNLPAKQFIVVLDGEIEVTTSLGQVRRFVSRDILLVENTRKFARETEQKMYCVRRSIFMILKDVEGINKTIFIQ